MSKRWYEHWLRRASDLERAAKLAGSLNGFQQAFDSLEKARKHTCAPDELFYLTLWQNRLAKLLRLPT